MVAGAAVLAVVLFVLSLTVWGSTSHSELCSTYRTIAGQVNSSSTFIVDVDKLATAAQHYPDSGVRAAGDKLAGMSGTFSSQTFYSNASAVTAACYSGTD